MKMSIPRNEHPNPQFRRDGFVNLNGQWDFEFDFGNSQIADEMCAREKFSKEITVPFCPESELSGIGYKDFIPAVWYRRKFEITSAQLEGRVFICFGAVDFTANVYINGKKAGTHHGGYTSFRFDITDLLTPGENTVVVNAVDDTRSPYQATGKQSEELYSHGCHYTRTTGIWQTVMLEFTPKSYIESFRLYPDAANSALGVQVKVCGKGTLTVSASYEGRDAGSFTKTAENDVTGEIALSETHLWEAGNGRLYDLELKFGDDVVHSYFGLRDLALDGYKFLINGKSVFQRLVLDQGFYPDGIYTAPDEQALINDIKISMDAGFNGARLHQKVFEPLFLYHCDRLGYLAWGEYPNWGLDYSDAKVTDVVAREWIEALDRDFNHPSIVGWCPFNETWNYAGREQRDELLETVYKITKACDSTRPCIDTSGNYHVITDIYDKHDYEQSVEIFSQRYADFENGGKFHDPVNERQDIEYADDRPVFVSEYGGIRWAMDESDQKAWGYGNGPKTPEEYIERYRGLTNALLDNGKMFGFCYTQLYDVEQEQNGVYTYARGIKFDPAIFKEINSRKAKIED
ncbi:MAG: beta-galactosidase [Clostridia bacterium]|nr:beta-galactosidase [Clostridia bacterium]